MNRHILYYANENDGKTFQYDEDRPNYPLPKLADTLDRYYESLKPFGTADELANSRRIIAELKTGQIGQKLQETLEQRAKTRKNWLEKWWEDYAYLTDRSALLPFTLMAQPFLIEAANVEISPANRLKVLSRLIHHTMELHQLIYTEQLKPARNPSGTTIYSNFLYRRAYNTVREPGELMDTIRSYFKPISQCNEILSDVIVIGKGRIFRFAGIHENGQLLSAPECLSCLHQIVAHLDGHSTAEYPVALFTSDNRSRWAQNRIYLKELSARNCRSLALIEQATIVVSLDESEPRDWSEISTMTINSQLHNKWADKSTSVISFQNGKFGFLAEHCCYDGSISVSLSTFCLLCLAEEPEPDWNEPNLNNKHLPVEQLSFDLDDHLRSQHKEVLAFTNENVGKIIVFSTPFMDYGRNVIKSFGVNPDSFIQMIIQLTYYNLHEEFVPTYETALMRKYYNGRTETVRSCTMDSVKWIKMFKSKTETVENKWKALKQAIDTHTKLMSSAINGNGIDRHLFGLWCVAYEADIEIPELFNDALYGKSGGGGNFVLSTSTLGYTMNNGFVGPMVVDGYGVFYTMPQESIWLNVTVNRDSTKTSAHKFTKEFHKALQEVKDLFEMMSKSKL